MFDIEYIFIKLRSKSVGETIELSVLCPDDNKTRVPVKIKLDDVEVQMWSIVGFKMRYENVEGKDDVDKVFNILSVYTKCITKKKFTSDESDLLKGLLDRIGEVVVNSVEREIKVQYLADYKD